METPNSVTIMASDDTTKKHSKFVDEPMGDKGAEEVPGVGVETAKRLKRQGINTARELYAHFILKSEQEFKDLAGERAYKAMEEWQKLHN